MWLIFLLISFGYSIGLGTFEVLRGVCPVPPVVEFNPKSMQTRIFCHVYFVKNVLLSPPMVVWENP